ncbi:MAG: MFS transporter [Pseudomonadota bacterium]
MPADTARRTLSPTAVIIAAGSVVVALSFGVRSVFGIVLDPMSTEFGWPREIFSLSLAIQNMVWGLAQPFFGLIADRYGDRRALWLGLAVYLAGMALSALGVTPLMQHLGAGVFVGMGIAGTAFGLVLSVVGRAVSEEKRARALALTAALGSLGQMSMPLIAAWLTQAYGWQTTIAVMALLLVPIAFCIPYLKAATPAGSTADPEVAIGTIVRRAFGHSSYVLLTLGFFVCGFHVAFMTVHLPVYVAEVCGSVALGAATLSIIGFANVIGTLLGGELAQRFPKPWILSAIYGLRAVVIFVFITVPPSPLSAILFSVVIGILWLATVPLTSGLVATMFGPRALGTLYGIVFLSHQVGSFLGVWIGGRVYDATGGYDLVWYIAIALGILSAIVHLPVRDRPWSASAPVAA